MEQLVSVEKAAELLGGLSHWTIRSWLHKGLLTGVRVGGRRMLKVSELERFIEGARSLAPRGKKVSAGAGEVKRRP